MGIREGIDPHCRYGRADLSLRGDLLAQRLCLCATAKQQTQQGNCRKS